MSRKPFCLIVAALVAALTTWTGTALAASPPGKKSSTTIKSGSGYVPGFVASLGSGGNSSTPATADVHGLMMSIRIINPYVSDGQPANFEMTIQNVSKKTIEYPVVIVGWSWDGQPASRNPAMKLPPGTMFVDKSKLWISIPELLPGKTVTVPGVIANVADRKGNPKARFYCLSMAGGPLVPGLPDVEWYDSTNATDGCKLYRVR